MNYTKATIKLPSGVIRYELRIIHEGRNGRQEKKRFKSLKERSDYLEDILMNIREEKDRKAKGLDKNDVLFTELYWLFAVDGGMLSVKKNGT
jgi:hypothetical protein